MSETKVELSEIISQLRAELYEAKEQGADHPLRLVVDEAEIELQVTVTKDVAGKMGVQFWVYSAGGEGSISNATVQKLRLKLKPGVNVDGKLKKVEISGKE